MLYHWEWVAGLLIKWDQTSLNCCWYFFLCLAWTALPFFVRYHGNCLLVCVSVCFSLSFFDAHTQTSHTSSLLLPQRRCLSLPSPLLPSIGKRLEGLRSLSVAARPSSCPFFFSNSCIWTVHTTTSHRAGVVFFIQLNNYDVNNRLNIQELHGSKFTPYITHSLHTVNSLQCVPNLHLWRIELEVSPLHHMLSCENDNHPF